MKIGIGKIYCITNTNRLHSTRPIGKTQPPCVKPDWWWYPRRNGRGEVIGDVPISVHAQCVNDCITNESRQRAKRTIGWVQTSCTTPDRLQIPRRNRRGVVDRGVCFWDHGRWDSSRYQELCIRPVSLSREIHLLVHVHVLSE